MLFKPPCAQAALSSSIKPHLSGGAAGHYGHVAGTRGQRCWGCPVLELQPHPTGNVWHGAHPRVNPKSWIPFGVGAQTLPLASAVSPSLNQHGTELQRLFSFFFPFFYFFQSKSLRSHRTQGILLYRNPFFRQLCQECFHTLGWMGKKKKGLNPPRWLFL